MSKIKTTKLRGVVKKLFNRRNVLFSAGLILVVLGVIIWIINFSFVKIKSARADETSATCGVSGCFSETWTASEMFGMVRYTKKSAKTQGTYDNNKANGLFRDTFHRKKFLRKFFRLQLYDFHSFYLEINN